jgi:hypothetical protein
LLDRSCNLADFKGMLSELLRDTGHIRWAPCKDVGIVPEETSEREFLLGVEVGPDGDLFGRVG